MAKNATHDAVLIIRSPKCFKLSFQSLATVRWYDYDTRHN